MDFGQPDAIPKTTLTGSSYFVTDQKSIRLENVFFSVGQINQMCGEIALMVRRRTVEWEVPARDDFFNE